jgi:hypothetical protein
MPAPVPAAVGPRPVRTTPLTARGGGCAWLLCCALALASSLTLRGECQIVLRAATTLSTSSLKAWISRFGSGGRQASDAFCCLVKVMGPADAPEVGEDLDVSGRQQYEVA